MNIVVVTKMVPDLVEELVIDSTGKLLDVDLTRMKLNEFDEHAIEQAIVLKEKHGAHVTVIAPNFEGVDDALFIAAARGVDRLVKLTGDFYGPVRMNNHCMARLYAAVLENYPAADLVLTGVQAHNDLDGALGPLLAGLLNLPFSGYIASLSLKDQTSAVIHKEYPGGLVAEIEIELPAVLGIQAADRPPGYIAFSKIRQAMKTSSLEEISTAELDTTGGLEISRLFPPVITTRAAMLEGDVDSIAERLMAILQDAGVV